MDCIERLKLEKYSMVTFIYVREKSIHSGVEIQQHRT